MSFDEHASAYEQTLDRSLRIAGQGSEYFARLKSQRLHELAARYLAPGALSILDVGCGVGMVEAGLSAEVFASIHGCDISSEMVRRCQERVPHGTFRTYREGDRLPYADAQFDVTFTACTLHHVPLPARPELMCDMARVTKSGGLVVVFEHNPYNPLTRAIVAGCEFDRDAILLTANQTRRLMDGAGLQFAALWFYIFVPPRLKPLLFIERGLRWLPLGGQYVMAGRVA